MSALPRRSRPCVAAALLCLLSLAGPARAIDYAWNNTSGGGWGTNTNWSPTGVPAAGDNVSVALGGTYTVTLGGDRSADNVTLNSANAQVNAFGSNFALGGTMTLAAGNWVMGGFMGTPVTLTGGTITRGAGATGTLTVEGDLRLVNTQIANAAAVVLSRSGGGRLRLSGTSAFTAGGVVTLANTGLPYPDQSGITFEGGGVVNNLTVNLGQNTTLGTVGGQSLTLGPNTLVQYTDPTGNFAPAAVGREFYDGTGGLVTLTNQGTIRSLGNLTLGRYFDTGGNWSNVNITNAGLLESQSSLTIHANTFTNAPGGVVRATAGGQVFVYAHQSWVNQGTFEVSDGGQLLLGGLFTRDAIGTVARSGTGTVVGIYAGWMDNSGGTWALTPQTGNYQLLGDSVASSGRIIGGAITASGGAKLEVRVYPGAYSGVDYCRLTGVAVGPGVLDFSAVGGKAWLEQGTTLAAGDTITLAGRDTAVAYFQTQQVDGLTFVLAGDSSALSVYDNNVLTLGPTTVVRKTGTGPGLLTGGLFSQTSGTSTAVVNRGLVQVQQGTLFVTGNGGYSFSNQGTVQVDAGAVWQGPLASNGGLVRGGGQVNGLVSFSGTGNELRPGSTAAQGRLTTAGLTLNAGTTLFARLNGTTPATGHDQVDVTGAVDLGGATLALSLGNGYVPGGTDKLFILTNDGSGAVTGTFAGLPQGSAVTVGGSTLYISYFGDSAGGALTGGNDVVLSATPVPEPATALAIAAGAAGVAAVRRLRRNATPQAAEEIRTRTAPRC